MKKKTVKYATMINIMKFQCEVCEKELPKTILFQGKGHELFEFDRPQAGTPYIVLVSQLSQKEQKFIHILEATKEMIKIGRGHNCEVRVNDISVSRLHSYLKYEDGGFVIVDNNSKFGTLVKVRKNIPVTFEKVAVQVGRSVITFVLKPK